MATEVLEIDARSSNASVIEHAARALAAGALVAFPTETVYGLAANAAREGSVRRLTQLKGDAGRQPFTVHIGRREECEQYVPDMPPIGRRLARKGWPGPLTLVFEVPEPTRAGIRSQMSDEGAAAVYVDNTVGIRFPDHPVTASILAAAQAPIIASSAKAAGTVVPIRPEEVREQLDGKIDLIVDGGPTRYGKGSTIVAVNGQGYALRRAGVFDERTVRRLASWTILFVCTGNTCRSPMAVGLLRRMLAERIGCAESELDSQGIFVKSAGTFAGRGGGPSENSVAVCHGLGIDISGHRTQQLTRELIQSADAIYTMGHHHLDVVTSIAPEASARASLLDPDSEISDPAGGPIESYREAAKRIRSALEHRIQEVPV